VQELITDAVPGREPKFEIGVPHEMAGEVHGFERERLVPCCIATVLIQKRGVLPEQDAAVVLVQFEPEVLVAKEVAGEVDRFEADADLV
jgi:hypothetical protein